MEKRTLNTENEQYRNSDDVLIVKREELIEDLPKEIVDAHGKKHKICKNDFGEISEE